MATAQLFSKLKLRLCIALALSMSALLIGPLSLAEPKDTDILELNARSHGGGVDFEASIVLQKYKDVFIIWDAQASYESKDAHNYKGEAIRRNFKDIAYVRRAKPVEFTGPVVKADDWTRTLFRIEIVFKDGSALSVNQDFTGLTIVRPDGISTEGFMFEKYVPRADVNMFFELFPAKLHSYVHVLGLGEPFFHSYALNMPALHSRIIEAFHQRKINNPLGYKVSPMCERLLIIEGGKD